MASAPSSADTAPSNAMPAPPGTRATATGAGPVSPGSVPVQAGAGPVSPGPVPVQAGADAASPSAVPAQPGIDSASPSTAPASADAKRAVHLPDTARELVKILVTGPFGVGKTTLIDSVSEIRPLHTEEQLTEASVAVDDLAGVREKSTTTVAIDFGRISLQGGAVLYLFGTPGQERFRSLWDDIAYGALGALVLVDTRRIDESFDALGLVEESGLPYAVALNTFPDSRTYTEEQLRRSLDLDPDTPMVTCDARDTHSSVDSLLALVQHLIDRNSPEQR